MSSRVSRKSKSGRVSPPRPPETSQPDLQIAYSPAGHETLAAISRELVFREQPPLKTADEGPEVSFTQGPAGRETLALIEAERPKRDRKSTLDYGDRIANAPGAKTPSRAPAAPSRAPAAPSRAPAAPSRAPAASSRAPAPPSPNADSAPLTIFEMLTFVVSGSDPANLASEAQRRRFVQTHLLARIPQADMTLVERIDVTPWTVQGTVVVRVWCKV